MNRRILSLILAFVLILSMAAGAQAAREELLLRSVRIDGTDLTVLCAAAEEAESYELTLEGEPLDLVRSPVSEREMGITVFCLVDTSGSISDFKYRLMTDTMLTISEALNEGDSMVIATIDNTLTIGEPLTTAGERQKAILAIESSHKDTNLYSGIVQSLERLAADDSYGPCRCLVVLSDGADYQDNGMTQQEVLDAVRQSRLPVYTVGLVEKSNEREAAKILGSFARNSAGGMHLTTVSEGSSKPIRTDVTGSEFGSAIMGSVNSSVVLEADLSGLQVRSEASTVRLELTCRGGNGVLTDFIDLAANDLPSPAIPTESEEPQETGTETTGPTEPPEPPPSGPEFEWWWLVIGLAVLLLIVLLLVLNRKKKQQDTQTPQTPAEPVDEILPTQAELPVQEGPAVPVTAAQVVYEVDFISIPYGNVQSSHQVPAGQPTTFGRSSKSARVLNPTDKQLSGIHFVLAVRDGCWSVQDAQSVNGTYLNGVPIAQKGWVPLNHHDKIRAGSYEYRVVLRESSGTAK